jgi:hypothetical protein
MNEPARRTHFMGVYYQTEYRLCRRGGVVRRIYTGPRAFLAIAVDLFFLLTFEFALALFFLIMRNAGVILLTTLTAVFYLLSMPFRFAHWVSYKLERAAAARRPHWEAHQPFTKPVWTAGQEI